MRLLTMFTGPAVPLCANCGELPAVMHRESKPVLLDQPQQLTPADDWQRHQQQRPAEDDKEQEQLTTAADWLRQVDQASTESMDNEEKSEAVVVWPAKKQHVFPEEDSEQPELAAADALRHQRCQKLSFEDDNFSRQQHSEERLRLEERLEQALEQLSELEEERNSLEQRLEQALEDKCELEELENDSRLR